MEISLDFNASGVPLFDTDVGRISIVATPEGVICVVQKEVRYLLPLYPVTPAMLKAIGDAAMEGEEAARYSSVLMTKEDKIGFMVA
jgi:hypothetical protein